MYVSGLYPAAADGAIGERLTAAVLLILAMVVLGYGLLWLRRRLRRWSEPPAGAGFELQQIRDLLREGKITPEEYQRLRRRLAADVQTGGNDGKTVQTPHEKDDEE
jgi:hypothetical protein